MQNTAERRQMILAILCERRTELAENLAIEFGVTTRTIYHDIEILAYSYPIITLQGKGGGIRIVSLSFPCVNMLPTFCRIDK